MKKILFVSEYVTLAHFARPFALANTLSSQEYEVHFATSEQAHRFLSQSPFTYHPIISISHEHFKDSLRTGKAAYHIDILRDYIAADRALIRKIRPDLVVGDFRLSLATSAELENVPSMTISNIQWSPYVKRKGFPMPDISGTPLRYLPFPIARTLFAFAQPRIFNNFLKPINKLRTKYGLLPYASLEEFYTASDHTLYADAPTFTETHPLPSTHHFVGPIAWSSDISTPSWWDTIPQDRPCIYITLGSSGDQRILHATINALKDFPVSIIASTAGGHIPDNLPDNVFVAPYIPGDKAVARADLVICNGGSSTAHQALAEGTPVIGIASNLDQFLSMEMITAKGAGVLMRTDRFAPEKLQSTSNHLLKDPSYKKNAQKVAHLYSKYKYEKIFPDIVNNIFSLK